MILLRVRTRVDLAHLASISTENVEDVSCVVTDDDDGFDDEERIIKTKGSKKRSKTDKKREKDKESRARQRNQPEIAAGSARHSQTQSKKEIKEVKSQKSSQGAIVDKSPKIKGLI
ncbi:hypothetical protein Tco_0309331 [Tanacetum coccineum]